MAWRIGIVGMAIILCITARAAGQAERASFGMGLGGGEAAMGMAIGRSSAERYADLLELDQAQREAAMLLHEAYLEEYKLAADAIERGVEDLTSEAELTRDRDAFRANIGKLSVGMLDRRMELEEQFLGDLETLAALPDPHADDNSFERVERARRRELGQSIAMVNGAWVDLFDMAEHVGITDDPGVTELLRDYEQRIDASHRRLIEAQLDRLRSNLELMAVPVAQARELARDEERQAQAEANTQKLADADTNAKATNERFARQIARALPEDEAAAWTDEFNRRAWPVVYRVSDAERVLDAAEGFEDLTGEQRERLDALRAGYERDAAAINAGWAAAIDAHQAGAGNP